MKAFVYFLAAIMMFSACKSDNEHIYRYAEEGYEYILTYPDEIDYATAERYAKLEISDDYTAIVSLMDSLIEHDINLDFWCRKYYQAMNKTMSYDSILIRLLKLQEKEPLNTSVYSTIGYTYNHLGDISKASEYFCNGLKIDPDNSKLWYELGQSSLQSHDTVTAISHFTKSLELAKKQNKDLQISLSQFMLYHLKDGNKH